jgi:hypothetical protein
LPVWFLSDAQRERLWEFPAEIGDEALDRLFTLSGANVAEARQRRRNGTD